MTLEGRILSGLRPAAGSLDAGTSAALASPSQGEGAALASCDALPIVSPRSSMFQSIYQRVQVQVSVASGLQDSVGAVSFSLTSGRHCQRAPLPATVSAANSPCEGVFNNMGSGVVGHFEVGGLDEPIPFSLKK